MKDSIYTIPLSEVFEPKDGCPLCRLRNTLEDRCLEYIMGAAMMEPDIRIETNKAGFCSQHFARMLKMKNRLSLALMLESRLGYVMENELEVSPSKGGLFGKKASEPKKESCFVCNEIDRVMETMTDTLLLMWQKEESFRQLYAEQPVICLEHYHHLTAAASAKMGKKAAPFIAETRKLTENYLKELQGDVTHFCRMYDYRSRGQDWGNSRDSIERAIWYLTSRKPEEEK
ncbi:MAG: hypothetical protein IJE98_06370 [Oscillospiraceae bacterium]|nr:hypothetical protein [Oscillospiraceae bacterium]